MWYFKSFDVLDMCEGRSYLTHEPRLPLEQVLEEVVICANALSNQATNFELIRMQVLIVEIHVAKNELMEIILRRVEQTSEL